MSILFHRRGLKAALLASAFALAAPAAAQEEAAIGLDAQTGVSVTIYNQDLALVKDRRDVTLAAGANRLAFIHVSAQFRPETALFHTPAARLDVAQQHFAFDILTAEELKTAVRHICDARGMQLRIWRY